MLLLGNWWSWRRVNLYLSTIWQNSRNAVLWLTDLLFLPFLTLEITESQNSWGWKRPLEVIGSKPPAQAGTLRAACPGTCPDDFWISPRMETPQHSWVTGLGHLHSEKFSQCSDGTFCLGPLPLVLSPANTEKSLAPPSLHPPFRYVYAHCAFSSLGWMLSSLSACAHRRDAWVP